MTRVLLFGASGFIGGPVKSALATDPRITSLESPGRAQYDLIGGSLGDLVELIRMAEAEVVVNCAGRLSGTAAELMLGNAVVTAKLVEAIATVAPGTRFVRLGSAGEYGVVPRGQAVAEDAPTVPVGAYGVSHLAATSLVCLASASGQVDGVVLRAFNPIGAGCGDENLLGRAARRIQAAQSEGANRVVLGPLGAFRDFVDTRDVASAVVAAVVAPRLGYRVFNVGSGTAVPVRQAVSELAAMAGYTGTIVERGSGSSRSAAVNYIRADTTRLRSDLGWKPAYSLRSSVAAIWNDLKVN
jgi:nucleoside-diphosphate-sugar epimerase